jgi:hypothetical protein
MSKRTLENVFFLCLGLILFFAINQHLVGKAATLACEAVIPRQKNFVFEILLLVLFILTLFSLYLLKGILSPMFILTALAVIVGLMFLQNYSQGSDFRTSVKVNGKWKAEKVWSK